MASTKEAKLMAGISKQLPVPYFTQPTATTCQSTVLKMMAVYLENEVVRQTTGAAAMTIPDIKQDINANPKRPDTKYTNSHANFKWWLESHFPSLTFNYVTTRDSIASSERILKAIDSGFPVLVSVSHARVEGHIILVVGYENYQPNMSSADFKWVVHDPYGQFDPSLKSDSHGRRRYDWGMSLVSGDEIGPGRNAAVEPSSISRRRAGDPSAGMHYLLFPTR
jgi:hypothetical protein